MTVRFVLGDELGNIKVLRYGSETDLVVGHRHDSNVPPRSVQKLAVTNPWHKDQVMVAAAFSDGCCCFSELTSNDSLSTIATWKETRFTGSKFVGISTRESSTFTCTASGTLRRAQFIDDGSHSRLRIHEETAVVDLPSRLCDWRMSDDGGNFAYGGEEVDLSVWNTECSFQQPKSESIKNSSNKRKRNDDLLPCEVWRARNLSNDHLGLRQPIRIAALAFLKSFSTGHDIMTGTQFGHLRRYDTRAGRRPTSNWTRFGVVGGIQTIEKGFSEHELFMSDSGSTLLSIDLRTGAILHRYKGISGAVKSIAASPTVMASVSLDRFARILAPSQNAGDHQDRKPEVLAKCYLNCTPTVIKWDQNNLINPICQRDGDSKDEDEDDWNKLESIRE